VLLSFFVVVVVVVVVVVIGRFMVVGKQLFNLTIFHFIEYYLK
jgi:hypothetical protein